MLFNEPKLLKWRWRKDRAQRASSFSALQRAEIAEIHTTDYAPEVVKCFSALQRAEIAEIADDGRVRAGDGRRFSALQRAEIAEMMMCCDNSARAWRVSVLFNEPKLLKSKTPDLGDFCGFGFSALQRAEIAEIQQHHAGLRLDQRFQCSSTSRNC